MSQIQFPYEAHLDSIVFSTEGLAPQFDNLCNGQGQTVTTGESYGAGDVQAQYGQCLGQYNKNSSYSYGTKEIFSGDSHTALQNQIIQTNPCGSSNNAGGRTLQGTEGAEEVLRQIHYVCGLPATYYLPFGGAPSLREINITPGPIVLPATTGNGTSFECHFNFNPQRASALTPPNGLVFPPQTDTSEVPASGTACSGSVYPPSYNNTWAMQPDTSALGPEAQAVAPQMNTVTPCVVCCNDRGWASVGAAACPIAPAPGPTPKMKVRPLRTASTNPPRDAEKRSHRICQKTRDPRAVGYKRPSTPRRVPLSRAQTAKSPPVPYEKDINILSSRLLSERAHPATVGVLCTQVFNNGVTERALKAKFIHMGQSANNSSVKRKYLLLLEHRSNEYYCLLCPQDRPVRYKNPQDSLRHLRKDHFGLALICRCGCDRKFYRQSEMNQHLKKRNVLVPMSAGEQTEVHRGSREAQ